ncbi:YraN family protein [Novosphingobium sp. KCTC 2891]|uniref:YraN family protein n=1 Tax=Novosphingobium sp. KCTC 2891 TaxID=2989730 RepID=UPI0022223C60|nr:YraN family protein [Novosphingobium sp. KCTC 2891]MCW1381866.1 YraN family protein [Novosphingobium sp. KCTC 2891]
MSASRAEAERRGRRGEALAALWLRLTGWRVLARRQRVGPGEVDIVARKGRTVAFIEVKWRASGAALDLAIDARRLRRVARAAEVLVPRYVRSGDDVRIDVILIAPERWPRRIVNAWQPGA